NRFSGLQAVRRHPLFAPLADKVCWVSDSGSDRWPARGWAVVNSLGVIELHPTRRGEPEEWTWVAAHCLLHLGFDHLAEHRLAGWQAAVGAPTASTGPRARGFDVSWNLAACLTVNRFLTHLKIGRPPAELRGPGRYDSFAGAADGEEALASRLRSAGIPLDLS